MFFLAIFLALVIVALALVVVFVNEAKKKVECDNMRLNREVNELSDVRNQVSTLNAQLVTQKALVEEAKVQSDFHFSKYQDVVKQYNDLVDEQRVSAEFAVAISRVEPVLPAVSAVKQSKPGKSKKVRKNK